MNLLFLGALRAPDEVGWYGAVHRLLDGVIMLPNVVNESLGPTLSANFGDGRKEVVSRLYRRGAKYLLVSGLFLAAVFAVYADDIVAILFGDEFSPAAAALLVTAPAVLFIFLRRFSTEVLDNIDRRAATAWVVGGGLALNAMLGLLLVQSRGYVGAAMATVVTEGCVMAAMIWLLRREGYTPVSAKELGGIAGAGVLAILVLWVLRGLPVVGIAVGASAYLAALTLLRVPDEKDALLVRDLFRRRARAAGGSTVDRTGGSADT